MPTYNIDNKFVGVKFWTKYYNATTLPNTFSGPYTMDTITYKKDTKNNTFSSKDNIDDKDKIKNECKSGFKNFDWDKPMLRKYFYSDDTIVKSGGNKKCLINKKNIHDLIEVGIPESNSIIENTPEYTTEEIVHKKKKKFSENKYSINWKFPERKKYEEKYSKHYPLPMATSIYIPEIKMRFELNSETRWYEPKLLYKINE